MLNPGRVPSLSLGKVDVMSSRSRKIKAIVRENLKALQSGAIVAKSPIKDSSLRLGSNMARALSVRDISRVDWKHDPKTKLARKGQELVSRDNLTKEQLAKMVKTAGNM